MGLERNRDIFSQIRNYRQEKSIIYAIYTTAGCCDRARFRCMFFQRRNDQHPNASIIKHKYVQSTIRWKQLALGLRENNPRPSPKRRKGCCPQRARRVHNEQ